MNMLRRVRGLPAVLVVFMLLMPAGAVLSQDFDSEEELLPGVVHVDLETAFANDAALLAEQSGISPEDARQSLIFRDAFSAYGIEVLLPRYEEQLSAIWVAPAPATTGYVQFAGEVPDLVVQEAAQRGLDIVFLDAGEMTFAEQNLRSDLAAKALEAAGYRNFIVYPDRMEKTINIELQIPEGASPPNQTQLAALIQDELQAKQDPPLVGRASTVFASDIVLTVRHGNGPVVELLHSRGGNLLIGTSSGCTSGWSVSGSAGTGIVTAGHCTGLNTFVEANGQFYSMNLISQAA